MSVIRKILAAAMALSVLCQAPPATSQVWLGMMIADQMRAKAEFEAQCRALAERVDLKHPSVPAIRLIVARYFTLSAAGDRKGLARLFVRREGAGWSAPGLEGDLRNLTDPFVPEGTYMDQVRLEVVSFVVGHDNESARGVWKITLPDTAAPGATREVHYGIELVGNPAPRKWYLYRVTVFPGAKAPAPPRRYCHLNEAEPFAYEDAAPPPAEPQVEAPSEGGGSPQS